MNVLSEALTPSEKKANDPQTLKTIALDQGFPAWGTFAHGGTFACPKGTFKVSNRRSK